MIKFRACSPKHIATRCLFSWGYSLHAACAWLVVMNGHDATSYKGALHGAATRCISFIYN